MGRKTKFDGPSKQLNITVPEALYQEFKEFFNFCVNNEIYEIDALNAKINLEKSDALNENYPESVEISSIKLENKKSTKKSGLLGYLEGY